MKQEFTISAKTCTLKYNSQERGGIILGNNNKFIIPIYQREYSWGYLEISKLINDIFTSYWGTDNIVLKEPMFIGTMQLTLPNNENYQEVIDGQQRLTTFLLILKVLKNNYPDCEELKTIELDWLYTKVNSGKQQACLEEAIKNNLLNVQNNLNRYIENIIKIKEIIEEEVNDIEGDNRNFDIDDFVKYLLSNIYFVVIETRAGLTKTLQIFNAINTTGLDLNGGDIFKIKFYEYLTSIKKHNEKTFEEISDLYCKIDEFNASFGEKFMDINHVLRIYQYILIARHNLPNQLYSFGADTFFERLFDTIFNTNQWEYFKNNVSSIELSIEDLDRIIEMRYLWQKNKYSTAEDACAMHLIWWSRYGKYWILNFVFLFKFNNEQDSWEKLQVFNRQLSKLYFIYSVRFQKSINDIHNFTHKLISTIINNSYDDVINTINAKIGKLENHKEWYDLEAILNGNIVYNSKLKNLVCRLSAMIDEDYKATEKNKIDAITNKIFNTQIDIEHIQSYHDNNKDIREDIWNEWGTEINSLGNLMVLEQTKNRSISNSDYSVKIKEYQTNNFNVVKNQSINYLEWNLDKAKDRKSKEVNKIISYIFS